MSQLGDTVGILGLLVSLAGFGETLYQVKRSRTAAEQSRIAAEQARDRVLELNALNGLDAAIVVLQDIRRLHRMKAWEALPDRYTSLMIDLRAIRTRTPTLSREHRREIQAVVTQLTTLEDEVERIMSRKGGSEVASMNLTVTQQINRLSDVLVELQKKMQG